MFGYDIGATSAVLVQLKDSSLSGVSWSDTVNESSSLQGIITSFGVLGAMIGSIVVFQIADALGRRRGLIIASTLYFLGKSKFQGFKGLFSLYSRHLISCGVLH